MELVATEDVYSPDGTRHRSDRPSHPECHLRIVHLVSSLQVGGMEQFVLRIARDQQAHGHRVTVIGLQNGPLLEEARQLGMNAAILGGRHTLPRIMRAAARLAWLRPDIVHAHNPSPLPYALLAKLFCPARVVLTRHGDTRKRDGWAHWRRADAVVTVSEMAASEMWMQAPECADKVCVIHNGVPLVAPSRSRDAVRAELEAEGALPPGAVLAIIVARIDRLKGHDCLLQALARLRASGVSLTTLVVGDGDERSRIQSLARQLHLGPEQIRFLGIRTDVPDLLAASDLFVLPSVTEGMPLTVLEAMAQRLPVIATPVGGVPRLITDHQQGLLIPVNDPDVLAESIAALAADPRLRETLGRAAYRRVCEQFTFERMVRQYEELYFRLTSS